MGADHPRPVGAACRYARNPSGAAEQLVDPGLGARLRIHALDDDGTVEAVFAVGRRQVAAHHHRAGGDAAVADLAGGTVVNLGALADVHAHGDDRVLLDDDTFHNLGAGAKEAVVLDDQEAGLHRLQHATDAHPSGQMDVLSDLGARTHLSPDIHHGAFIHVGAYIHVGWHQHHVFRDVAPLAGSGGGHHAEAAGLELLGRVVAELGGHLVEVLGGAAGHDFIVTEAEGDEHRLLDPLVHGPLAVDLLGHPQAALVQAVDDLGDRLADDAGRGGG